MNSKRAKPTPLFGISELSNADSGFPTFIIIFTGTSISFETDNLST